MSRLLLSVRIPGEPVGKGRPRVAVRNGRAHAYTPAATASWEARAEWHMGSAWGAHRGPEEGPVSVRVLALKSRPKALLPKDQGGTAPKSRPPVVTRTVRTTKPDGDNVIKAAADALVNAGVLRDDVQVVRWEAWSLYPALGEEAGVIVEVWAWDGEVPA